MLNFPYFDKAAHFTLFGLLSFLLLERFDVTLAVLLPLTGAGVEEMAQSASRYRTCDIWDFAADVAGVAAFQLLALWRCR